MNQQQSSLVNLLQRVESGDADAEQRLWDEFFGKLLRFVGGRVRRRGVPTGLIDEEAVAVSALESVFKCAKKGQLQSVQNWSELSRLLLAMTNRKFVDHFRRATALKAYPGVPLRELSTDGVEVPEEKVAECSADFEDRLSRLMDLLPDEPHRQIAVLKLAGYTLAEISEAVGRAVPTVSRKWAIIRRMWANELEK